MKSAQVDLTGYFPGLIGRVVELHASYYHEHWGLDLSFEIQVATELSRFMAAFVPGRDGFWAARCDGEFAGFLAIDGSQAAQEGARLRWFIVAPEFQGRGVGNLLIREGMRFCQEAGHKKVFLWTFEGLDVARRLYEQQGFSLTLQQKVRQWGRLIREQRFEWKASP